MIPDPETDDIYSSILESMTNFQNQSKLLKPDGRKYILKQEPIIRERKFRPHYEVKVKKRFFVAFSKISRIFLKLFFSDTSVSTIRYKPGNIFASGTCSQNPNLIDQNI